MSAAKRAHETVLDDLAQLVAKERDVRLGRLAGADRGGRRVAVERAHLELDGERDAVGARANAPVDDRDVDVEPRIAGRRCGEGDRAELRRAHRRRRGPQRDEAAGEREGCAGEGEEAGEENGAPGHRAHRSYRRVQAVSGAKFPKARDPLRRRTGDDPKELYRAAERSRRNNGGDVTTIHDLIERTPPGRPTYVRAGLFYMVFMAAWIYGFANSQRDLPNIAVIGLLLLAVVVHFGVGIAIGRPEGALLACFPPPWRSSAPASTTRSGWRSSC